MQLAIDKLNNVLYNDFRLNEIIDPDKFDVNFQQIVDKLDEAIDVLNTFGSTEDGNSGADNVSLTPIETLKDGEALNTVQSALEQTIAWVKTYADHVDHLHTSTIDGNSGADNIAVTPISDLKDGATDTKLQTILEKLSVWIKSFTLATSGSGSALIGSAAITGINGNTVYAQLKSLRQAIDQLIVGQIPLESVSNSQLVADIKVGSLASLLTDVKSSVVAAINELHGDIGETDDAITGVSNTIGDLENLLTQNKISVVAGINEVKQNTDSHFAKLLYLQDEEPENVNPTTMWFAIGSEANFNGGGVSIQNAQTSVTPPESDIWFEPI
jgi:hypothetical protein